MFRSTRPAPVSSRLWAFAKWLLLAAIVRTTEAYFARECRPLGVFSGTTSITEWKRQLEADRAQLALLRAIWEPIQPAPDDPAGTAVFGAVCALAEVIYLRALWKGCALLVGAAA